MGTLQLVGKKEPFNYKPSTKDDKGKIQWMYSCIAEASPFCEPEHKRVEENEKYTRGFQWADGDAARQKDKERPAIPLNDISKGLSSVANREIMDRYEPKVFGREEQDDGVAELLNSLCKWQRDQSETEHEESRAFRQTCGSGYGVMHKWWDDAASDGNGAVVDEEVALWTMLWDPKSRKQNLVDRKYHLSGKYVPIDEVMDRWGDNRKVKRDLKNLVSSGSKGNGSAPTGGTASDSRWGWNDVTKGRWFISSRQEVFLVEFEWKENKKVWKVAYPVRWDEWAAFTDGSSPSIQWVEQDQAEPQIMDQNTFASMDDWSRKNFASSILADTDFKVIENKAELDMMQEQHLGWTGMELEATAKMKEEVKFMIVVKDIILAEGVRPQGFTYEFLTGIPYEQKDGMRYYGFVDMAKGPQDMKNVLYSNLLTQYMTSNKGILMMEEGMVENPSQFSNDYAKLNGLVFMPDGSLAQWDQRTKTIATSQFPQMTRELLAIVESGVESMLGINSLDGDLRRIAGTVAEQANKASATILAVYFDSLKRFRKRFGMLNIRFLQIAYKPKEMARIVGGDIAQALAGVTEWPDINRMDVKVEESPTTVSEQMDAVKTLVSSGTLQNWTEGPNPKMAFADAVDMMQNLPKSVRERIKKNSKQMEEFSSTIQNLQSELQKKDDQIALRDQWLLSVDRGGELKTAWDTMYAMALEIDRQRQEKKQQEEQQQQQGGGMPPVPQPETM